VRIHGVIAELIVACLPAGVWFETLLNTTAAAAAGGGDDDGGGSVTVANDADDTSEFDDTATHRHDRLLLTGVAT